MILTKHSGEPLRDTSKTVEAVVRKWLAKLALNAGQNLDAQTQRGLGDLWIEGLADLPVEQLERAFLLTFRSAVYWPIKVADIRKHVTHAEETASTIKAEEAWQAALKFRVRYWRKDLPNQLASDAPRLSERFDQSMRAAGVCVDYDDPDQLNVWCKKRFIEYYLAWTEMEREGKFLLPQGELRDAIAALGEKKSLRA